MPLDKRSKPDFQPWNHERFCAGIEVQCLRPSQRSMYMSLLHWAFFYSTRPDLPVDDDMLWMLASCDSKEVWMKNKDAVLPCFQQIEEEGRQRLIHPRLRRDWARLVESREKLSELQRERVNKRWARSRKKKEAEDSAQGLERESEAY